MAGRREPCIVVDPLHLHHTPLRELLLPRTTFLHLPGPVKPEIRMACPLIRQFLHTEHPGLECPAHCIEEIGQWTVAGALARGAAGGMHPRQGSTVILHCCCQCLI